MNLVEAVEYIRELIFMNTREEGEQDGIRTFWEGFNGERPSKTYMTVEILEPYLPISENKECAYVSTEQGLERQSKDTFESILQFKIYAAEEKDCVIAFSKFQKYAVYKFRMDLNKKDMAYVSVSTLRGLMNFEEDDKEVIKTFDLKIRMTDVVVDEVDYFTVIQLKGCEGNVI